MSTLEMHEQFSEANVKQRAALQGKGDVMIDVYQHIEEVEDPEWRTYMKVLMAQLLQQWGEAVKGLGDTQAAIAQHEAEVEAES